MRSFTPANWYWLDTTLGIYSSANNGLVAANDPTYTAWLVGGAATAWPKDASGAATAAALDAVLASFKLPPTGLAVATQAELNAHAAGVAQNLLTTPRPYIAAGVTVIADASQGTRTDLGDLAQWGVQNLSQTQTWVAADLSTEVVTGAQFVALAPLVGAYALTIYAELAAVLAQIKAGAIATAAQIDAYAWTH